MVAIPKYLMPARKLPIQPLDIPDVYFSNEPHGGIVCWTDID